jgi:hypothetical protein
LNTSPIVATPGLEDVREIEPSSGPSGVVWTAARSFDLRERLKVTFVPF